MKVFLTGATGFVGRHVAARLINDKHSVRCLVRSQNVDEANYLSGLGAELAVGDILDADSLATAAAGCDAFIHLVGIIFQRRGSTFEEIHVRGTFNALAAASLVGVKRFIHMSALGTGPDAASEYHRTKWQGEEAVRGSGLTYTIFRPSVIYGLGGEFIHMLISQIKLLPLLPVIGNGNYRLQPISVEDVASCFSSCLNNDKTFNQVYGLGGPDQLSYDEMLDTICLVMGKQRLKLHIPVALVKPVAWLSERLQSKPMLTTDQLTMLLTDNICDIGRMKDNLGIKPVAFEDGMRKLVG